MSALEIIMVSVSSVLVFCITLYFIIFKLFKKLTSDKAKDFVILNKNANTGKLVFLGDSLTDFFPVNEFFPNVEIYNRGIAGDTTMDVMNRLDEVKSLKPHKLFIQIGINDFHRHKVKPEVMVSRIMMILEALQEIPNIYVISLYPLNRALLKWTWLFRSKAKNPVIRKVNHLLESACLANGYTFINMYDGLVDEADNLKREYTLDGIHLSIKGYEVVADKLSPYIKD